MFIQDKIFGYLNIAINIVPLQQEKCEENFKKSCYIDFVETPRTHEVEECNTNLTRNCDIEGEEVCTDEFETGNTFQ